MDGNEKIRKVTQHFIGPKVHIILTSIYFFLDSIHIRGMCNLPVDKIRNEKVPRV